MVLVQVGFGVLPRTETPHPAEPLFQCFIALLVNKVHSSGTSLCCICGDLALNASNGKVVLAARICC